MCDRHLLFQKKGTKALKQISTLVFSVTFHPNHQGAAHV